MKVVIVSDDPESQLYNQITKLKKDIEDIINTPVDLISISAKKNILDINGNIEISKKSKMKKHLKEMVLKIKYN